MIDFLIVGGGIGGAVLAHLLARQGRQVLVLERETAPRHVVRPEIVWPATVRALEPLLGPLPPDDWRVPVQGLRFFVGGRPLVQLDEAVFLQAGVRPNSSDPNVTRAHLLADPDFEIQRGVEMTELLRQGSRIAGVRVRDVATGEMRDLEARYVIGDDGARSRVREGCGLGLATRELGIEMACFEFTWPERLPAAVVHVVLNPRRGTTGLFGLGCVPWPRGRGMGLVAVRSPRARDTAAIQAALEELDEADTPLHGLVGGRNFPEDFARFQPQFGHAARYGADGAILLGDAAHPVTPAGGQGANMAIADALALADCVQEGEVDLLPRYEQRRREANARSLAISQGAARTFRWPAWLVDPLVPWLIRWFGRRPSRAVRGLQQIATAFVD